MAQICFAEFDRVEMHIGRVVKVEDFPKARKPAYKLWIDFGEELGIKRSSAQLTRLYSKEDLEGRLVVAVTNFPPRQVADFFSEVLVLGAERAAGEVVLLQPERALPPGSRII